MVGRFAMLYSGGGVYVWGPVLIALMALGGCQRGCESKHDEKRPEPSKPAPPISLTHGTAAGDPSSDRITLWARASAGRGVVNFLIEGGGRRWLASAPPDPSRDGVAKTTITGLEPATSYRYRVWASPGPERLGGVEVPAGALAGGFSTLPVPTAPTPPLRLAWGGDLAGQNVCRHASEGFPIFDHVVATDPDLFIGLGDMIYADGVCRWHGAYGHRQVAGELVPALTREEYWAHWRYAREDTRFRRLLASTSYVGVWDDHEIVNDVGPHNDVRSYGRYDGKTELMPPARRAMYDYLPLEEDTASGGSGDVAAKRLWRRFAWGAHVEVFVLDTRSYRDANAAPDTGSEPKTMLGSAQKRWFVERVGSSTAIWKIVVCSVPLSIPTGHSGERDGWADHGTETGYERELLQILDELRRAGVSNVVFITTDVHFGSVFEYVPFAESPEFVIHELVVGPLNAGLFAHREYDETLNPERLFFYGPDPDEPVTSWNQARRWFNFGVIEVDAASRLHAALHNGSGEVVYELRLDPRAD